MVIPRVELKAARKARRKEYREQAETVFRLGGATAVWRFVAFIQRPVRCPDCAGRGRTWAAISAPLACICCLGTGIVDPSRISFSPPGVSMRSKMGTEHMMIVDGELRETDRA